MNKKRFLYLVLVFIIMIICVISSSCSGAILPQGEYISEEPYLYLNITNAEQIIDFDGKINLNGDDCDIIFSINKQSRHFEIKQDDAVLYEGYFSTEEDGKKLLLKTNETSFELERKE
ncbi:MAG: hypothetical protein ACI4F6_04475 [Acutalibacteraceae bacterium]